MNNPIMYVDPSGCLPVAAVIGIVIGVVAAVMLFTPVCVTVVQVDTSAVSYAGYLLLQYLMKILEMI